MKTNSSFVWSDSRIHLNSKTSIYLSCSFIVNPIISWDYASGPNEIITDKQNGLLIENQHTEKLIEAMNLFVLDNNLYLHCKDNAISSVKQFSLETIGNEWLNVFDKLK